MRADKTGLSLAWDSGAASWEVKVLSAAFPWIRSEVGAAEVRKVSADPRATEPKP